MVRGRQAKFAGIEHCRKSRFVFDFLRRRFDCLAAEVTVMFQHAPKPASNSPPVREPSRRTAAAVQAKPARAQGSAGWPQAGFGDIAIHPPRASRSGLPDRLKSGIEALSGISMDGVRVHRNSARPGNLDALAFAQGRDIHLAPGQDHHLPHEAWHLVQQAQGRVRPTLQAKTGEKVNDDGALEREADTMGARAARGNVTAQSLPVLSRFGTGVAAATPSFPDSPPLSARPPIQAMRSALRRRLLVGTATGAAGATAAAEYEAYKSRNPAEFDPNVARETQDRATVEKARSEFPKTYLASRAIDTPDWLPAGGRKAVQSHMKHSALIQVHNGEVMQTSQQTGSATNTIMDDDADILDFDDFREVSIPPEHMATAMTDANKEKNLGAYTVGRRGISRAGALNVCHNQAFATLNNGRELQHAAVRLRLQRELAERKKAKERE